MIIPFLDVLQGERIKLRRSLLGWLLLCGGAFVPVIMFAVRLRGRGLIPAQHLKGIYWERHWTESWESLSIMILPLMVVLLTTLILQVEYRNNTWKQVHAAPQRLATIFWAKLATVLLALIQLLGVITLGLFVAGALPCLMGRGPGPWWSPLPLGRVLSDLGITFLECLPVVAIQFVLALRFRNFLVPVGVGTAGWILSLVVINTKFNFLVPYAYTGIDYLVAMKHRSGANLPMSLWALSLGVFAVVSLAGQVIYFRQGTQN